MAAITQCPTTFDCISGLRRIRTMGRESTMEWLYLTDVVGEEKPRHSNSECVQKILFHDPLAMGKETPDW